MRISVLIPLLLLSSVTYAQSTGSATLVGTVTDSSGSLLPGAKLTVLNMGTSFLSESATTTEGSYYVPNLIPGTYRLTIEAAGFKKHVREGITLRTNESPRIDVMMEIGTLSDTINVAASTPLLETETSASGQIMDGETVVKMPVMQKGIKRMTLYMPGLNVVNGLHGVSTRTFVGHHFGWCKWQGTSARHRE